MSNPRDFLSVYLVPYIATKVFIRINAHTCELGGLTLGGDCVFVVISKPVWKGVMIWTELYLTLHFNPHLILGQRCDIVCKAAACSVGILYGYWFVSGCSTCDLAPC